MTEGKYYTVMELAENIGVPRTTINDWLNKYAQYMDFTMQGKRRIYSENTLAVLQKVSQLRSSGLSSFDIERELAANYAIHPETAVESPVQEKPETSAAAGETGKADTAEKQPAVDTSAKPETAAADESHAIVSVSASQNDEIAILLGERFRDMLEKMDSLEKKTKASAMRAWFFFALASILVILLGVAGFYAYQYALSMERSNAGKDAALSALSAKTEALNDGNKAMHKQIESLKTGLDAQKKEFQAVLEENRNNYEKRREAELAAQKDCFAAERLVMLQKMEALQKEVAAKSVALKDAKQEQDRIIQEKNAVLKEKDAAVKKANQEAEKLRSEALIRNPDFQFMLQHIPDKDKK